MTERSNEWLYWRLSCALLVLSPLAAYLPARVRSTGSYVHNYFLVAMIASIFIPYAIMIVTTTFSGQRLKFWVVKPTVEGSSLTFYNLDEALQRVTERLNHLGFKVESIIEASNVTITFAKSRSSRVVALLDNAFSGTVCIKAATGGSRLTGSITLEDTTILDTGEREGKREVLGFILLERDEPGAERVPLLVYTGSALAFAAIVATALSPVVLPTLNWALSIAAAAASISLASMVFLLRDRNRLIGWRLTAIALLLCSVPWILRVLN